MLNRRTSFEVSLPFGRYDTFLVSAVVEHSSLTFDLLTLKLVCIIVRGIRNLLNNVDVSGTFRSRLVSQHLSDAPRDIATLTFDLAGDGPSRRYGSSSFICTPSLKFVGLSVRKI